MKRPSKHQQAQAMVEFALVLPILLLLIVGIIEVGRAIFIYSSVVNASREAARYGSAYGRNDAGYPRYQDCQGIKNAAKKVAFMSQIEDDDVTIDFDRYDGADFVVFDQCEGALDGTIHLHTSDRITVTVTGTYEPMTPLIPLDAREITVTTSRTIIGILTIHPEP